MKKTVSRSELIEWGACEDGFKRFAEQSGDTDEPVAVESLFNGKNTVSDLTWLAGKICTIEKIQKFARDVALVNVELIKPHCSDADYKLILHFLNAGENAYAARDAAAAAARAAADARDAAAADADAAAYAAYAAAAADAAAYAAAYAACIDFTPYLKELFS